MTIIQCVEFCQSEIKPARFVARILASAEYYDCSPLKTNICTVVWAMKQGIHVECRVLIQPAKRPPTINMHHKFRYFRLCGRCQNITCKGITYNLIRCCAQTGKEVLTVLHLEQAWTTQGRWKNYWMCHKGTCSTKAVTRACICLTEAARTGDDLSPRTTGQRVTDQAGTLILSVIGMVGRWASVMTTKFCHKVDAEQTKGHHGRGCWDQNFTCIDRRQVQRDTTGYRVRRVSSCACTW